MIRGTNHDQDARFQDKTKRMLEKSNWPEKYDTKIDLRKVDYQLIKIWIQKKITSVLGEEDDIVSGTLISHMEEHLEKQQKLNAKKLHIAISGFLQEKTLLFMSELWDVLDEAQKSARGIPECLIQEKKKNEQQHRKTLDQLNAKRHKINTNYFNNLVHPTKGKFDHKKQQSDFGNPKEKQHQHKKSKKNHRQCSRDKTKQKKHRSRSNQKNKVQRSRDKKELKKKHKRRSSSSQLPKQKRSEKKRRSDQSDSSGVLSSSNSQN